LYKATSFTESSRSHVTVIANVTHFNVSFSFVAFTLNHNTSDSVPSFNKLLVLTFVFFIVGFPHFTDVVCPACFTESPEILLFVSVFLTCVILNSKLELAKDQDNSFSSKKSQTT
jgi:hypothetical protein